MLKGTETLKKNYQFQNVYKKGISIANRQLVMIILKNNLNVNRLGITVSKKVGISVVRSRVTRLIRESYRLNETNIINGFDIVIIARSAAALLPFSDIQRSFLHLAKKHGMLLR